MINFFDTLTTDGAINKTLRLTTVRVNAHRSAKTNLTLGKSASTQSKSVLGIRVARPEVRQGHGEAPIPPRPSKTLGVPPKTSVLGKTERRAVANPAVFGKWRRVDCQCG